MAEEKRKCAALVFVSLNLALSTSDLAEAAPKKISSTCEQHINDVSISEGVPLGVLYAVALTESGLGGQLNPYALNIEGVSLVAKSRTEALVAFEAARKNEKKLIDIGCMQVNYFWHQDGFKSVEDMFDPKQNISYAAKLLKSAQLKHGSWTEAVARYHSGPRNKVAQHRYVCKVLHNMIKANFAGWTPEAKSYCTTKAE